MKEEGESRAESFQDGLFRDVFNVRSQEHVVKPFIASKSCKVKILKKVHKLRHVKVCQKS